MSVGYLGKTVNRPNEVAHQQAQTEVETRFGEMPGEIVEFDPVTQKAIVKPLYMPKHNGVPIEMPFLEEVPVRFDRVLKGGFTYPIEPGDRVMLRPQMRNTERFHTEDVHISTDTRAVSLSDMEAFIDGGESLVNPIPNFEDLYTHWRFEDEGLYGWKGSFDGRMRCDLAAGEFMDTVAEFCESHAATASLSGNIQLLDILIELTDDLITQNQTLIDSFTRLRVQTNVLMLTSQSDATGWTDSATAFTALASEPDLVSGSIYSSTSSSHTSRASRASTTAGHHDTSLATYDNRLSELETTKTNLNTRRAELVESRDHFRALSTTFRAMELRT